LRDATSQRRREDYESANVQRPDIGNEHICRYILGHMLKKLYMGRNCPIMGHLTKSWGNSVDTGILGECIIQFWTQVFDLNYFGHSRLLILCRLYVLAPRLGLLLVGFKVARPWEPENNNGCKIRCFSILDVLIKRVLFEFFSRILIVALHSVLKYIPLFHLSKLCATVSLQHLFCIHLKKELK